MRAVTAAAMWRPAFPVLLLGLLAAAACTQHADGECVWVPGDDGTCGGRGGGDGCSSAPTPRVHFLSAAVSRQRVVVRQTGAEGEHLWSAPLAASGQPTAPIARVPVLAVGEPALWDGGGTTLLTMTSYQGVPSPYGITAVPLAADGTPVTQVRLTDELPHQLAVVFDGEAFVIAWREWNFAESVARLVVARMSTTGTLLSRPAAVVRFDEDDGAGMFGLATDGAGGALLTWTVRLDWRLVSESAAGELRALRLHDGVVTDDAPRVLATDFPDACLRGTGHALVHTGRGYRALLNRYPCSPHGGPPALRELAIDVATGTATEAPSPLPFTSPPDLIAGADGSFLAVTVGNGVWRLDADLATATPALALVEGDWLVGAGATDTGYAVVTSSWQDDDLIASHLTSLDPAPIRVTVALGYLAPDDGGCSAGTRPPLAAALLTVALLFRRRRRSLDRRVHGRRACASP